MVKNISNTDLIHALNVISKTLITLTSTPFLEFDDILKTTLQ